MSRKWFTAENTSLPAADRSILNRAARLYSDEEGKKTLSFRELCLIRKTYHPGLSARDVVDIVSERE